MYSRLNERDIETHIDNVLRNLDWEDNPKSKKCNVSKQKAKTKEQAKSLNKSRPDYILYKADGITPLAVIEVKRPHQNIEKAKLQAVNYAKKIKAPIVFATDGIFTTTYHLEKQNPLYLNREEVDDLMSQKQLLYFVDSNEYITQSRNVIQSREELIKEFKNLNNLFRDAGVKSGLDRINLLSNMLFLKIISELSDLGEGVTLPSPYQWDNIKKKQGLDLLDFLNKQAFDYFKKCYGGEVLSKIELLSGKENKLEKIIEILDKLSLSDTNSDIKGDAFEFFLRNYGGAETDFGEYFTPRHIVKFIIKILNPKFGEKIYDPFCGTGGMLIESFKHIKKVILQNEKSLSSLRTKTVYGGEITTISRIAKMNMILIGDGHSNIKRQDSYENPRTNKYEIVITNIPFGKRMNTEHLNRYGYNGKSAEVAGVLHCLDALHNTYEDARAGILIPEGVLFNCQTKIYQDLRKELVEKYNLEMIVSFPSGIFPDANVKSNLIVLKPNSKDVKDYIWHFTVNNDGYTLNKARTSIGGNNDLNVLLSEQTLDIKNANALERKGFKVLHRKDIKKNKYVLLPAHYEKQANSFSFPTTSIAELENSHDLTMFKGKGIKKTEISPTGANKCILYGELYTHYPEPFISKIVSKLGKSKDGLFLSKKGDVLIPATTTADAEGIAIAKTINVEDVCIGADINVIRINDKKKLLPEFLTLLINFPLKNRLSTFAKGANILHLTGDDIKRVLIPIPPLDEQRKAVKSFKKDLKHIEREKEKIKKLEKSLKTKSLSIGKKGGKA